MAERIPDYYKTLGVARDATTDTINPPSASLPVVSITLMPIPINPMRKKPP